MLEVEHVRTGVRLSVDEVEIALRLETRGPDHCRGRARRACAPRATRCRSEARRSRLAPTSQVVSDRAPVASRAAHRR